MKKFKNGLRKKFEHNCYYIKKNNFQDRQVVNLVSCPGERPRGLTFELRRFRSVGESVRKPRASGKAGMLRKERKKRKSYTFSEYFRTVGRFNTAIWLILQKQI